jgi:hypothetical protein
VACARGAHAAAVRWAALALLRTYRLTPPRRRRRDLKEGAFICPPARAARGGGGEETATSAALPRYLRAVPRRQRGGGCWRSKWAYCAPCAGALRKRLLRAACRCAIELVLLRCWHGCAPAATAPATLPVSLDWRERRNLQRGAAKAERTAERNGNVCEQPVRGLYRVCRGSLRQDATAGACVRWRCGTQLPAGGARAWKTYPAFGALP